MALHLNVDVLPAGVLDEEGEGILPHWVVSTVTCLGNRDMTETDFNIFFVLVFFKKDTQYFSGSKVSPAPLMNS